MEDPFVVVLVDEVAFLTAYQPDRNLKARIMSALATLTTQGRAVGYGVVAPTLPFLARGAGAGDVQIGFLVGLYAAVGLVAGVPFGALANRLGRRPLVLVGLGCLTIASVGFVLAPSYAWLVGARFAQGLGATAIWVGALTIAGGGSRADLDHRRSSEGAPRRVHVGDRRRARLTGS